MAGAVGFATALRLAQEGREAFVARTSRLRDRLWEGIVAACPDAQLNGHLTQRLPHNLHLSFAGVEGEAVVEALDEVGIECSAGAACTSATWEPSHVLLAMGVPLALAIGSVRLTLSSEVNEDDIDTVIARLPAALARLRTESVPATL